MKLKKYTIPGIKARKESFLIKASSWNGSENFYLVIPDKPTLEEKEIIQNFVLGELDEHDGWSEIETKWKG